MSRKNNVWENRALKGHNIKIGQLILGCGLIQMTQGGSNGGLLKTCNELFGSMKAEHFFIS
jgi:hypothetical protein